MLSLKIGLNTEDQLELVLRNADSNSVDVSEVEVVNDDRNLVF